MPPDTDLVLTLSEVFDSIQGEGASAGAPRTFVRLAGCNLTCSYCDTPYSWDFNRFDKAKETRRVSVAELGQRLKGSAGVVLTGGEPLLQQRRLVELVAGLSPEQVLEVETNGTIVPEQALLARVDQWNVSVKLGNSGQARRVAVVQPALAALRASGRMWLKCVVEQESDVAAVEALRASLKLAHERVLLQPQAVERETLRERSRDVVTWCRAAGFGFSPRLHVAAWGDARGR